MAVKISSNDMLQRMAHEYSNYFKVDIYSSISKLQDFLEESAAKLDELSSLFEMNEAETSDWIDKTLPEIIQLSVKSSADIKRRIDTLELLVGALKTALDKQEAQIAQAEHSFGNQSSLRSVLNYFMKYPAEQESLPKIAYDPVSVNVDSYFSNVGEP